MRSKLTLCPTCTKLCDTCGQPLRVLAYCPPCAGGRGGSSRSAKKQESSRRNIERTKLSTGGAQLFDEMEGLRGNKEELERLVGQL